MDGDTREHAKLPPLNEDELKRLSRRVKDLVPKPAASEEEIGQFKATLDHVFAAASTGNLSATHRVAAWNTLCAVIDQCTAAGGSPIQHVLWKNQYWRKAFDLYLAQASFSRPKSSKQLLATLTGALRTAKRQEVFDVARIKVEISAALLQALIEGEDHARAKSSALALSHFLSKDVLTLDDLLIDVLLSGDSDNDSTRDKLGRFLGTLFRWMSEGDFGSTIGTLVSVTLDKSTQDFGQGLTPPWAAPLRQIYAGVKVDASGLRAHLLPTLFKRSSADYFSFLSEYDLRALGDNGSGSGQAASGSEELLYVALQAGKDAGMLRETDAAETIVQDGILHLPIHYVSRLLQLSAAAARLTGLSLLITSPSTTTPMLASSLRAIRRNLHHLFGDTDANFRGEVLSLMQRLIDRTRAITAVLTRQACRSDNHHRGVPKHCSANILSCHRDFLAWLSHFLLWELRPTASYQHHISALKCLSILARSGLDETVLPRNLSKSALGESKWGFYMPVLTRDLQRLLLDLVIDPFDDVRQAATAILYLYPSEDLDGLAAVKVALDRAEAMMLKSGRADQADGVAHLYALIHGRPDHQDTLSKTIGRLGDMLNKAEANLTEAVAAYPVHGLLTAVRRMIERGPIGSDLGENKLQRLNACLHEVWEVAKPILCNDAPEGYLPEDMDETGDVATKDTLSYCWRALKEASLLLGAIAQRLSDAQTEFLRPLCDLCFTQLAELRHRGAFSTVAQTWITCAVKANNLLTEAGESLLQEYYDRAMLILTTHTTINTRRSAGLPSLLCGILVADQGGKLMKRAISELAAVSRELVDPAVAQEGSLPQAHAMNCLKDILKNSRLGEASEHHVPTALRLAADALQSDAWAVRNCGLMLFRAVIDRLLGTSESYLEDDLGVPRKLSTDQHPQLLGIVLELLGAAVSHTGEVGLNKASNEGVFSALQLLQRLEIPPKAADEVQRYVQSLMASPVWHIRDKAARTYASLVPPGAEVAKVQSILKAPVAGNNALHGTLLCVKHICRLLGQSSKLVKSIKGQDYDEAPASRLLEVDFQLLKAAHLYHESRCYVTRAAYLDIHVEIISCLMLGGWPHLAAQAGQPTRLHDGKTELYVQDMLPFGLASIIRELRSCVSAGGTAAPYRLALCRTLACHFFSADKLRLPERDVEALIEDLSTVDTDAIIALLDQTALLVQSLRPPEPSVTRGNPESGIEDGFNATIQICSAIPEVQNSAASLPCKSLQTLLAIDLILQRTGIVSLAFNNFAQTWTDGSGPPELGANEHGAGLLLQIEAVCIDASVQQSQRSDALIPRLQYLAKACTLAISEEGVATRVAAALALQRLKRTWFFMPLAARLSTTHLHLCLAVYDLLNDDDEDNRLIAAEIVTNILEAADGNTSLERTVPVIASQRLIALMLRTSSTNVGLVVQVLRRAFGFQKCAPGPVQTRLAGGAVANTALFVEEKQNLYIDESREAKAWSQAALLLPATAFKTHTIRELCAWVTEGLGALLSHAEIGQDGPLGWTTQAETFTLVLQCLYGSELLLHLASEGRKLSVRPSTLRRQLAKILLLAQKAKINELWRKEADRILASSVVEKMQLVSALVVSIDAQTASGRSTA